MLNVIAGDGETGAALVDHEDVDKIAFTGSTVVGREIGAKAGRALKRVTLELGGKSPNIILPDADLEAAIRGAYQAIYYNTGQACNAGSRLFVHADQYDEVMAGLVEAAGKARLGPGLDPGTQLGPLISAEQEERVRGYIEKGKSEGAELVTGGDGPGGEGYFVEPTLFSATRDDLTIAREEIFGPVLVALPYDSIEEVARRANDTDYGLAAGVWTTRPRQGAQAGGAAARRRHLGEHLERRRPVRARSAASRRRGSDASTAARGSRPTSRTRRSGSTWARLKRSGSKGARSSAGSSPQIACATRRPVSGPCATPGALVAGGDPEALGGRARARSPGGRRAARGASPAQAASTRERRDAGREPARRARAGASLTAGSTSGRSRGARGSSPRARARRAWSPSRCSPGAPRPRSPRAAM